MSSNLYDRSVAGPFTALCGGNNDDDGSAEDCLTVAPLTGGGFALGDTKAAGAGRELRMSAEELTGFARRWLADNA